MMEKDGQLSLSKSQGNQNKLRHHHSIVERDREEEESSIYKEQGEVEDKQEVRNSAHRPT